ncbi:2538_t:CDS:2 [Diversispora eburnea]|uniref:holo-[acyl-carrier-protein] synthase n=1 Tax=Diversispora eburnea TaxID=1213867 RepID=A0A9N9F2K6_9GLOM|nr:2538_t:CDS:2 [Diversispora eburnea]
MDPKITARWAFDVSKWNPSNEQYKKALSYVQPEESERIQKFRSFQDSKLALIGRLLMRFLFCKIYNCNWKEIRFGRTKENRPILLKPEYLINNKNQLINFNISHHGDWVVLVSSDNFLIGVDVMKVEKSNNLSVYQFFECFKDQFSGYEWNTITSSYTNELDQLHLFYRYWCLKESYVKAIGIGLALDLKSIEFHLSDDENNNLEFGNIKILNTKTSLYINNKLSPQWKFEESYLDELHLVGISYSISDKNNISSLLSSSIWNIIVFHIVHLGKQKAVAFGDIEFTAPPPNKSNIARL